VATIYTIGHSTRPLDDLIAALKAHDINTLVDIRSFPMSRRMPHFNRDSLELSMPESGINYVWEKRLGGRRKKIREDSPNTAIRNDSFRNYADYMLTEEFRTAARELIERAERERPAIMCAERVYFHCHRMMVSDWLAAHGHTVLHIDATGPARPHRLMAEARIIGDDVIYDGGELF
jgi:uncharacterized protein (DUF488 family)